MLQGNSSSGSQGNPIEPRQFRGQLSGGRTNYSYKAADYSQGFAKRDAWLTKGESEFLKSFDRNAKIAVENAKVMAQDNTYKDIASLAQFSKTLTGFMQKQAKWNAEDKIINDDYEALMGVDIGVPSDGSVVDTDAVTVDDSRVVSDQDRVESQEATQVLNTGAGITERYRESTGDVEGAAMMQDRILEQTGGERVLQGRYTTRSARAMYAPWLSSYLQSDRPVMINGQQTTVRQAIASGDPVARAMIMQGAARFFLQDTGLAGGNRRELVKDLAPTIFQTNGQMLSSLTSAAIKDQQAGNISQLEGQAYTAVQSGTSPGVAWRQAADSLYQSNTGLSRRQANEKALEATLKGMIARGDVDGINQLRGELQVPGQAGTELGSVYGAQFDQAVKQAQSAQASLDSEEYKQIRADMYQELGQLSDNNPAARAAVVERYAQQLESIGQWEKAAALRSDVAQLSTSGQAMGNAISIRESILAGGDISQEWLDEQRTMGLITTKDHAELSKLIGQRDWTKDETFKSVLDIQGDYAEGIFLQATGLKKDELGKILAGVTEPLLDPATAGLITGTMKEDLKKAMAVWAQTYGKGLPPGELQQKLSIYAREWIKDNLNTQGGKYDTSQYDPNDTDDAKRQKAQAYYQGMGQPLALAASASTLSTADEFKPQNHSASWDQSSALPDSIRVNFRGRRGDTLFTGQNVQAIRDQWNAGKVSPQLESAAQQLGMTPLSLLNQQLKAYKMETIQPRLTTPTPSAPSVPNPTVAALQTGTIDRVAGANYLVQQGFTRQGAAYLAGNIQQESSWVANRSPWDDVGAPAGGLVSWRGDRLANLEAAVGKPVQQMTVQDQLDYMMTEMKTKYPQAYATFTNPHATPRQLERASFQYWGYGEVGDRFTYAQQILPQVGQRRTAVTSQLQQRQLRTSGSTQSSQRSNIPYVDQTTAANGEGGRQCFSAVSTMLLNALGQRVSYDQYNTVRGRYGDTTTSSAQVAALRQYGINASVQDNGSLDEVARIANSGTPVPIGIQHNSGSGHWILVTGVTPEGDFVVHDPFGQLVQQRNGGWAYTNRGRSNAGQDVVYSRSFLTSVFEDRGPGTGRIMRVS